MVTVRRKGHLITVEDLGLPDALLWFLEGAFPPPRRTAAWRPVAGRRLPEALARARRTRVAAGVWRWTRCSPAVGRRTRCRTWGWAPTASDGTMRLDDGDARRSTGARGATGGMYREIERLMREISEAAGGQLHHAASCGDGRCARCSPPTRWAAVRWATIRRRASSTTAAQVWGHPGLFVVDGAIDPERAGRQSVAHDRGPGRAGGVLHGPRPGDDRNRRPGAGEPLNQEESMTTDVRPDRQERVVPFTPRTATS